MTTVYLPPPYPKGIYMTDQTQQATQTPAGMQETAWRVRYPGAGASRITESAADVATAKTMGATVTPLFEYVK